MILMVSDQAGLLRRHSRIPFRQYSFQSPICSRVSFNGGAIIKYVMRAGYKDVVGLTTAQAEIVDLQKGIRFAQMRINQLNGETEL